MNNQKKGDHSDLVMCANVVPCCYLSCVSAMDSLAISRIAGEPGTHG